MQYTHSRIDGTGIVMQRLVCVSLMKLIYEIISLKVGGDFKMYLL